jgi:hypothetical protein
MAGIQGTLTADFSSFSTAVENAVVQLRGFEASTNKVESAMTRMTDNFSGRKVITEATLMLQAVENVGGVSHLTEAELAKVSATAGEAAAKLRAMGQDVPPGMQKIADAAKDVGTSASSSTGLLGGMERQLLSMFSIGAVVAFGREVLAAGDTIQKMADQTGLGIDEVQKLQFVAGQSGTSIESLIGAVQNLQVRLGDDNTGAAGAMAKLGIHADAFNKLGTYDQMTTLAAAVQGIQSPTEQASVAAALFGKTWKEILPAIKSGMKELGDEAPIMADSTVKSLDRIGDAMKRSQQQAVAWGGGLVLAIEGAGFAVGDFLSTFDPSHWGVPTSAVLKLQGELNDPGGLTNAILAAEAAAKKLPPAMAALVPPGVPKDLDAIIAKSNGMKAGFDAAVEALKKWNAAVAEVTGSLTGWQETLDTIDGSVVEAIKVYLSAGASQEKLATMYQLTAEQIKAVSIALQEEASALASTADFEAAAGARRLEITRTMTAATNDLIIADLRRKEAEGQASDAFLAGALKDAQAQDAMQQGVTQTAATTTTAAGTIGSAFEQGFAKSAAAFDSFKGVVVAGTGAMAAGLQAVADGGAAVQQRVDMLDAQRARGGFFIDTGGAPPPVQTRAGGGPVTGGSSYLVGERGPELFTPASSGSISPNGGGVSVVNHIYVNGTAADVARQVASEILKTVQQGAQLS